MINDDSATEDMLAPVDDGIDIRLKHLSYSSTLTLHSCPRKFQLDKLREQVEDVAESSSNTTFAFGHVVGTGVQQIFEGLSFEKVLWNIFTGWHADLFAENEKQLKSIWYAIHAVTKFYEMVVNNDFLAEYELLYWNDKPATELGFRITTPDNFKYRGFVDAVLRHRETGEIVVLEVKTTSSRNLNPAQYKNSAQALGYSVVLDVMVQDLSSYKVMYLVYKTQAMEWEVMPFNKTFLQRAQWIQQLILDVELVKRFEEVGVYPMYGESCFNYYSECEYFGLCTLNTSSLIQPATKKTLERLAKETFAVELTLADLISAQLEK